MEDKKSETTHENEYLYIILKIFFSVLIIIVNFPLCIIPAMSIAYSDMGEIFAYISFTILPALLIPLVWFKKKVKVIVGWILFMAIIIACGTGKVAYVRYQESLIVSENVNIRTWDYLPFEEETKIAKLDYDASLSFTTDDELPVIDGAAAFFPVYSAYVNAVYPDTVSLFDGTFEYNNTTVGYEKLAEKKTDIFIGVYPSEDQIAYAETQGTELVFTPIGSEAFVFFVHKNHPVDNLTVEQVKGIYSGEITQWNEVGGKVKNIDAYQRNEDSGSQSMLIRFMGDKPLMEPRIDVIEDSMWGIIERVADYKNSKTAIGFSYRYYVSDIIGNSDIKLLNMDGIAPTNENIKNGTYPITTPIYAVTYKGNDNPNVQLLLDWIVSDEGQELLEKSGYAGIN